MQITVHLDNKLESAHIIFLWWFICLFLALNYFLTYLRTVATYINLELLAKWPTQVYRLHL